MSKQNINKNSDQLARLGAVTRQTRETEILVEVNLDGTGTVSYTHLTLPTNREV